MEGDSNSKSSVFHYFARSTCTELKVALVPKKHFCSQLVSNVLLFFGCKIAPCILALVSSLKRFSYTCLYLRVVSCFLFVLKTFCRE